MNANLIASSHRRLVLGLGESGRSVLRFWQARGVHCIAADSRAALADDPALAAQLEGVEHVLGELPLDLVDGVEEVIASPGVPMDHPLLLRARENGARIRGDIDLFMEAAAAPVVGITGSNGKSTVTALLGDLLDAAGHRVAVGGNLGKPALDLLDDTVDYYVIELSSFQLERAEPLGLAAAAVLNITPDHLDRHGTMASYQQAKHRIFRGAKAVVCHAEDPLTTPLLAVDTQLMSWRVGEPDIKEFGLRQIEGEWWFCRGFEPIARRADLQLAGAHNTANGLAALALGAALGLEPQSLAIGLRQFSGLAHRTTVVAHHDGLRFVDDSKATNVGATVAALEGLGPEGPIVLIAGGQGKGQDFRVLRPALLRHCAALVVLGEAGSEIATLMGDEKPVRHAEDMVQAVRFATELAGPGATVLLSPACASFDQFSGFAERGDAFAAAVTRLTGGAA